MSHGPWESETQRSEGVLWGTWDENDHLGVGYEGPNVGPCGSRLGRAEGSGESDQCPITWWEWLETGGSG